MTCRTSGPACRSAAARAAAHAAAYDAAYDAYADAAAYAADAAARAAAAAAADAYAAYAAAHAAAYAAAAADYELLLAATEAEAWTHGTPVPPAFFGPLWPEGEPEGWPEEAKEERVGDKALDVTIEIPDGVSDAELLELVEQLGGDMERFYRANGGRGLVIGPVEIDSTVDSRVVVPS
ncbi:MAG: hypothetical protein AAFX79_11405 [Planctomycetota bacterium]